MDYEAENDMFKLLLSYREMAMDPSKHKVIVKDKTMVQFLAYSLDSDDEKVVAASLETLDLLIQNRRNHDILRMTFGILESILATSRRTDLRGDICSLSARLHSTLESSAYSRPASPPGSGNMIQSKANTNLYNFHIFGLNEDNRDELVSCLVGVRGVVSVVVDVAHQRCTVRAMAEPTKYSPTPPGPVLLAQRVTDNTCMYASLIVKNNANQEVLQLIGDYNNGVEAEDALPEYLPDEDSPVKEKAIISFDKIRSNASTWVRSASAFLQEAFYW